MWFSWSLSMNPTKVPDTDRHNYSRTYLLNRVAVALGGRAAEKNVFDELTNGAADDLKNVTQIVRRMVCQWGMSERIGPVTFSQGEEHVFLGREMAQSKDFSEHTGRLIDEEVQRIVGKMEHRATQLLEQNRPTLNMQATVAQSTCSRPC